MARPKLVQTPLTIHGLPVPGFTYSMVGYLQHPLPNVDENSCIQSVVSSSNTEHLVFTFKAEGGKSAER